MHKLVQICPNFADTQQNGSFIELISGIGTLIILGTSIGRLLKV